MAVQRPELNLAQVVGMILQIESDIKIPCLSYGLYDRTDKVYITEQNHTSCHDYYDAYDNRCRFRYTHDPYLSNDVVIYLLKHHGEIYFPMLKRNTCKAYVAQFDMDQLLAKYGEKHAVTPDKYFKDKFCWSANKNKTKQYAGQLTLPLVEML